MQQLDMIWFDFCCLGKKDWKKNHNKSGIFHIATPSPPPNKNGWIQCFRGLLFLSIVITKLLGRGHKWKKCLKMQKIVFFWSPPLLLFGFIAAKMPFMYYIWKKFYCKQVYELYIDKEWNWIVLLYFGVASYYRNQDVLWELWVGGVSKVKIFGYFYGLLILTILMTIII